MRKIVLGLACILCCQPAWGGNFGWPSDSDNHFRVGRARSSLEVHQVAQHNLDEVDGQGFTLRTIIQNTSNHPMFEVQALDSLVNHLSIDDSLSYVITTAPSIEFVPPLDLPTMTANASFDGDSDPSLLGAGGILDVGQIAIISYDIAVLPQVEWTDPFTRTITVSGLNTEVGDTTSVSVPQDFELPVDPAIPQCTLFRTVTSPSRDDATHATFTVNSFFYNTGNTSFGSIFGGDNYVKDSLKVYVPTFTVTSAPTFSIFDEGDHGELLRATVNTAWDGGIGGSYADPKTNLVAITEMLPTQWFCVSYQVQATIAAGVSDWAARGWAKVKDQNATVMTREHVVNLNSPPTVNVGVIMGTCWLGEVTGSPGAYALPCSVAIRNNGTRKLKKPVVIWDIGNDFPATSSLTSIQQGNSTDPDIAFSSFFDGFVHDSLTFAVDAETLFVGETDTLSFLAIFDEGDQTSWSTSAAAYGVAVLDAGFATALDDSIDCGHVYDDDGDGITNDENEPCTWGVPAAPAGNITTVKMKGTGNWVGSLPLAQGELAVSDLEFYGGNGIGVRNDLGVNIPAQVDSLCTWPDGSVRIARLAFKNTRETIHEVYRLSSPPGGAAVTATDDPAYDVTINGNTTVLTRAMLGAALPAGGTVYRTAYGGFTDTSGGATWGGQPGGIQVMIYHRNYADGTYRDFLGFRNQRACETSTFDSAGQYNSGSGAQQDADITVVRKGGRVMKMRWATDCALPSGDQASLHIWHSGSYNNPSGQNFGGKLRAGEDLWIELTDQSNENPPEGWYEAGYYKLTKAMPSTDNLVVMSGPHYNSADSLKWRWESRSRGWIEGVDLENPYRADWKNIRDYGGQIRLFDGGDPAIGMFEGNDQYLTDTNTMKLCYSMSRVNCDSLVMNHPNIVSVGFKLFEQAARKHAQGCYNIEYNYSGRDYQWAWGTMWPHTHHSSNDIGHAGRSSQRPAMNYTLQGDGCLTLWYATGWDPGLENYLRLTRNRYYLATSGTWGPGVRSEEARCAAGVVHWLTLHYDFTGDTTYRDQAVDIIEDKFLLKDFTDDPCPPVLNQGWYGEKLWMWNLLAIEMRQLARVLERRGDTSQAATIMTKLDVWQDMFAEHGVYPMTYNGSQITDGFPTYPLCTDHPNPAFTMAYYSWGSNDAVPQASCYEDDSFWAALAGSVLADWTDDPTLWENLWRSGVAYVGDGLNCLCGDIYSACGSGDQTPYQKWGVASHWSWDALRKYEGDLTP